MAFEQLLDVNRRHAHVMKYERGSKITVTSSSVSAVIDAEEHRMVTIYSDSETGVYFDISDDPSTSEWEYWVPQGVLVDFWIRKGEKIGVYSGTLYANLGAKK